MIWSVELRGLRGDLHLDLKFRSESDSLVLIGPNGAGKTTLLKSIAGARTNPRGRISLRDRVLLDDDKGVDVSPHERRIGYVPQGYALFPTMTVLENVAFGCGRGENARYRAREELRRFEALNLAHRRPAELSAGEKQRVALARAFAPRPDAILLDEPLAAMDPATRRRMRTFMAEYLREAKLPVIFVTHDIRDVRALEGEIIVLDHGRLAGQGTPKELTAGNPSDFIAEFFELDI